MECSVLSGRSLLLLSIRFGPVCPDNACSKTMYVVYGVSIACVECTTVYSVSESINRIKKSDSPFHGTTLDGY